MKWNRVVVCVCALVIAFGRLCAADAKDDLTKAMRTLLAAKSYRVVSQTVLPDGKTSTGEIEFQAPDRYHMVINNQTQYIIVGNQTYAKPAKSNKWMKVPVDVHQTIAQYRDPKVLEALTKTTDAKFLGKDTVNGVPARVYQYTLAGGAGGAQANWVTKLWVGPDDLPLKSEAHGKTNGKAETTSQTYDYKTPVNIQPPL